MTMKSLLAFTVTLTLTSSAFAEDLFNPTPMSQLNNFSNSLEFSDINPNDKKVLQSYVPIDSHKKQWKSTNKEIQNLQDQDRDLEQFQRFYAESGNIPQAAEMGLKRIQLRAKYNKLIDMQAITNFDLGDNMSLSDAMSRATGRQVGIQPLTNGNFNLVVDGQTMRSNVSRTDIKGVASTILKFP